MIKPLLARFSIPLGDEEQCGKRNPLVFRHWLPLQDGDALNATEGDVKLRFWIDN